MKSPPVKFDFRKAASELEAKSKNVTIHRFRSETLAKRVVLVCEAAKDVIPVTPGMFKYRDMLYVCLEEISTYFGMISQEPKVLTKFMMKEGQNEIGFVKWNEALQNVVAELFIENLSIPEVFNPATDESDYDKDMLELQNLLHSSKVFDSQEDRDKVVNLITTQSAEKGKYSTVISPDSKAQIDPKLVRIEKEIGRGGFGVVYKARYKGEEVAVKSIPENQVNENTLKALEVESNMMRRLSHPRIVAGYGLYKYEQFYCVIMEYLPNGSLSNYISTKPPCMWEKRVDFALDIAQGMAFLHKMSIVHRDLKPGNIVLDAHDRAKITDFGLSVVKTTSTTSVAMTEAGTAAYMAPENFGLSPVYSTKSDVFAFAMILWELSHWKLCYEGVLLSEIKDSIRKGERLDISEDVPPNIANLTKLCWNQDPRKRPSFDDIVVYFDEVAEINNEKFKQPLSLVLGAAKPPVSNMISSPVTGMTAAKTDHTAQVAKAEALNSIYAKKEILPPLKVRKSKWRQKKYIFLAVLGVVVVLAGIGTAIGLLINGRNANVVTSLTPSTSVILTPTPTPSACQPDSAFNYFTFTYAGSTFYQQGNKDGPLADALFNNPIGLAIDANDNFFVSDQSNYVIKYINSKTGGVSTIAGIPGVSGNINGAALSGARFSDLGRLCVQNDGSLIIVDGAFIKKLDSNWTTVSTIHTGTHPRSIFCDKNNGDIWIADSTLNTVYTVSSITGQILKSYSSGFLGYRDGPISGAQFNSPQGITKDNAGNVYVGDTGNAVIRVIRTQNDTVETLAGNGTNGWIDGPISSALIGQVISLAIDNDGNLIFIQLSPNCNSIRKINLHCPFYNVSSIVAGCSYGYKNGLGTIATGNEFKQLALNVKGDIFSPVYYDHNIRRIYRISSFAAADAKDIDAALPTGVCEADQPDNYNVSVYAGPAVYNPGYNDGPILSAQFRNPQGIAIDTNDNLYIADTGNYLIRFVNRSSGIVSTIAGSNLVQAHANGAALSTARFVSPYRLCLLKDGSLIILDDPYVKKLDPTWTVVTTLLSGGEISAIYCDGELIWIADGDSRSFYTITASGTLLKNYGSAIYGMLDGPINTARFGYINGFAKDTSGNMWIADGDNTRIRVLRPNGLVETVAGNGVYGWLDGAGSAAQLGWMNSLVLDTPNSLMFGEFSPGCNEVRRVSLKCSTYNTTSVVAGCKFDFANGLGSVAKIDVVHQMAVDSRGNVYIMDDWNHNVRLIQRIKV